jgi:hypothetical protein
MWATSFICRTKEEPTFSMTITENKPRVLALPGPALRAEMFTPEAEQALASLADVTWNETGENWTSDQLAAAISGYDGLITGWGTPKITPGVLAAADRLRIGEAHGR